MRVPQSQYEAATVMTCGVCGDDCKSSNNSFIFAALFTTQETNEPCRLLKLQLKDSGAQLVDSFTPKYDEVEIFKSCF